MTRNLDNEDHGLPRANSGQYARDPAQFVAGRVIVPQKPAQIDPKANSSMTAVTQQPTRNIWLITASPL